MKTANIHGWLKRSLWSLALLGVLLISFHRPVLRAVVDRAGLYYADKNGYELDWQIRGSIISDLSVSNLRLIGPQDGTIRSLHVNRASVQINLWRLLTQGPVEGILSVFVADATIEADTRKSPKSDSRNSGPSIPELWLQRLDLQNINVRIHTIDGAFVLQGFTLLLDESKAGKVQIAELVLPGSKARFVEVSGKSEIHERSLVLSDLVITPDVTISRLMMDFRQLKTDSLPFEAVVRSGQATLESFGRIDNFTSGPSIDLTLKVNQMAHSELDRWVGLPDEFSWVIDSAIGHIKGALDEPLKLRAELTLAASEIRAKTMHFQRLVTR
jgi:hypothetical protein